MDVQPLDSNFCAKNGKKGEEGGKTKRRGTERTHAQDGAFKEASERNQNGLKTGGESTDGGAVKRKPKERVRTNSGRKKVDSEQSKPMKQAWKNKDRDQNNDRRIPGGKGRHGNKMCGGGGNGSGRCRFHEYMGKEEIDEGVSRGRLFKGLFRVNAKNKTEAYFTVDGLPQEVLIKSNFQNRAMAGDRVAVKILPVSHWWITRQPPKEVARTGSKEPDIDQAAETSGNGQTPDDSEGRPPGDPNAANAPKGQLKCTLDAETFMPWWQGGGVCADPRESLVYTELPEPGYPPTVSNTDHRVHAVDDPDCMAGSPLVQELRAAIQNALKKAPATLAGEGKEFHRLHLPVVWHRSNSVDEAKFLIREVVQMFPELRPTGQVVGIVEGSPKRNTLVGVLQSEKDSIYFMPQELSLPEKFKLTPDSLGPDRDALTQESMQKEAARRTLVKARFVFWGINEELPMAEVCEVLGRTGDIEVETTAILEGNGVTTGPFSEECLMCLPETPWSITEDDLADRWDLRQDCIFTVDPPSARDLDDALSITALGDGKYRVGVHIADVSHFVKPNTALDKEACRRTTSVYLIRRVYAMLPNLLCQELCSLNPGVDRLAFSIIWKMDENGNVSKQEIGKSVIRSCIKLGYPDAQQVIDGNSGDTAPHDIDGNHTWQQIKEDVLAMHGIAQKLRSERHKNGGVRLDIPKLSFDLDDKGYPLSCRPYITHEANHMIEEFMLLANMSVAKFLAEAFPEHALLRMHPEPKLNMLVDVEGMVQNLGVDANFSSALGIAEGLQALSKSCKDPAIVDTVVNMATKSMQLAMYFCTGELAKTQWSHYGLGVQFYTHFTSPIRRYPDLVVHRLLHAALKYGDDFNKTLTPQNARQLHTVAQLCNEGKLAARNAQDMSSKLFLTVMLERHPALTAGVVSSVRGTKFFDVYVPKYSILYRVFKEDLGPGVEGSFDKKGGVLTLLRQLCEDNGNEECANGGSEVKGGGLEDRVVDRVDHSNGGEIFSADQVREAALQVVSKGCNMPLLRFPIKLQNFQKVPVYVNAKRCLKSARLNLCVELAVE